MFLVVRVKKNILCTRCPENWVLKTIFGSVEILPKAVKEGGILAV